VIPIAIKLIVKGSITEVIDAAKEHGIEMGDLSRFTAHQARSECTVSVPDRAIPDVLEWFVEETDEPFPVGTLLHYTMTATRKSA
jgi:hypothetical protein